ncbi:hypothetical protein QQP08_017113 [Theobroma cacao]|nr:hypothetical protein QQP08_017113 [Theobroma cacao]
MLLAQIVWLQQIFYFYVNQDTHQPIPSKLQHSALSSAKRVWLPLQPIVPFRPDRVDTVRFKLGNFSSEAKASQCHSLPKLENFLILPFIRKGNLIEQEQSLSECVPCSISSYPLTAAKGTEEMVPYFT